MNALLRPSARALYPLGITFSMLVLASSLNLVVDALLLRPWPLVDTVVPSPPGPEAPHWAPLNVEALANRLGLRPCRPFRAPASIETPDYTVRRLRPFRYEVTRRSASRASEFSNACEAPSVRIVPVRDADSGVFRGFRLFRIQPDSFASHFGLCNGDTVRSINGMDLSSHERALEIYTRVKEASRIVVEVEREGKRLRHTYLMKWTVPPQVSR